MEKEVSAKKRPRAKSLKGQVAQPDPVELDSSPTLRNDLGGVA